MLKDYSIFLGNEKKNHGKSTAMMEEINHFTTPHPPAGNNGLIIGNGHMGGNFGETLKSVALGNHNIRNPSNPFNDQSGSTVVNEKGNFFFEN